MSNYFVDIEILIIYPDVTHDNLIERTKQSRVCRFDPIRIHFPFIKMPRVVHLLVGTCENAGPSSTQ